MFTARYGLGLYIQIRLLLVFEVPTEKKMTQLGCAHQLRIVDPRRCPVQTSVQRFPTRHQQSTQTCSLDIHIYNITFNSPTSFGPQGTIIWEQTKVMLL